MTPNYISFPGTRSIDFCTVIGNWHQAGINNIISEGIGATYTGGMGGSCSNGWVGSLVNNGFQPGKGYIFTSNNEINNFQWNIPGTQGITGG